MKLKFKVEPCDCTLGPERAGCFLFRKQCPQSKIDAQIVVQKTEDLIMLIRLPDGNSLELAEGSSCYDAALKISEGLARKVLCAYVNDKRVDLRTELHDGDQLKLLTFDDVDGRWAFRHSSSHLLAQAVKRLYPTAKLAIGPAIDDGFYYDIDFERPFTAEDLEAIEKEMEKIVKEDLEINFFILPRNEALDYVKKQGEPYKVELIEDLPEDAVISFYTQGEFTDLCAGPHVRKTGQLKAVKLMQVSGAYWRGSEKNKMLQRIYGTSFPDKKLLKEHLERMEEARKRDHNKLGRELGYFTTVDYIGQGLPIIMPKGATVFQVLQRFIEDEERKRGYQLTMTPYMAKSDLYKISGHWDHYRDGMFVMGCVDENGESKDGEEVYALRPMTCPFQYQVFLNRARSYRDLPMRLNETSKLFRNESSGEMHGLIRVRQFTLSEGHIICTPEQVEQEFMGALDLANFVIDTLDIREDVSYRFSCWDPKNREKYIGEPEEWEHVQGFMKKLLDKSGLDYITAAGEAAFYGPKLDIQFKNVFGKEDTLITIQIDFQVAQKFGMQYTGPDGEKKTPYIVHRSSIGCYERTLAMLIEKHAGAMPLWIAPEQVRILPIADRHGDAAQALKERFVNLGLRAEVDYRDEKIGKKIRDAQMDKIPYMLVLGDKEIEEGMVSLRHRKLGDLGSISQDEVIAKIKKESDERVKGI